MAQEWYYAKHGILFGPVTLQHLSELTDRGAVGPVDLVWNQQMVQWVAAGSIKGLFVNVFSPPLPPPLQPKLSPSPQLLLPPPPPPPPPAAPTINAVPESNGAPLDAVQMVFADQAPTSTSRTELSGPHDLYRAGDSGRRAKWILFGWSAACLFGVAYGFVRDSALLSLAAVESGEGSLLLRGGFDVATWCVLWAVIGLPSLTVWLLSKK